MADELRAWNEGGDIDLKAWVSGSGNFSLAVGYTTMLWPALVQFDGYILRDGFSIETLRSFEAACKGDRRAVETVMNHRHLADLHSGCDDVSPDKLLWLGHVLREIYEAKLLWQFPTRPCTVSFHIPQDRDDLIAYEVSFWQKAHELPLST